MAGWMDARCYKCQGACCKYLSMAVEKIDDLHWWGLHGEFAPDGRIEINAPCNALDKNGQCTIYHRRPHSCTVFEVGSDGCRRSIERLGYLTTKEILGE